MTNMLQLKSLPLKNPPQKTKNFEPKKRFFSLNRIDNIYCISNLLIAICIVSKKAFNIHSSLAMDF